MATLQKGRGYFTCKGGQKNKYLDVGGRCQGQTPDSGMNRHELTVQHIHYILARTLLHIIISRMSSM